MHNHRLKMFLIISFFMKTYKSTLCLLRCSKSRIYPEIVSIPRIVVALFTIEGSFSTHPANLKSSCNRNMESVFSVFPGLNVAISDSHGITYFRVKVRVPKIIYPGAEAVILIFAIHIFIIIIGIIKIGACEQVSQKFVIQSYPDVKRFYSWRIKSGCFPDG